MLFQRRPRMAKIPILWKMCRKNAIVIIAYLRSDQDLINFNLVDLLLKQFDIQIIIPFTNPLLFKYLIYIFCILISYSWLPFGNDVVFDARKRTCQIDSRKLNTRWSRTVFYKGLEFFIKRRNKVVFFHSMGVEYVFLTLCKEFIVALCLNDMITIKSSVSA